VTDFRQGGGDAAAAARASAALPLVEAEPDGDATPGRRRWPGHGIGQAALLIGGLTVLARILGFARTVVFAGTVKTSCLSAAYVTANQVPNVIYDIVLGGALTAIVVPVLAGPAARQARGEVSVIASAMLTWTVAILVPVSVLLALAAGPVARLLIPPNPHSGCARAGLAPVAAHMLEVFAPQIALYGLAVVLYGILQAHRRFTAPALAPVLSSIVVIAAYEIFVPLGGTHTRHVAGLPRSAELVLSVGTTLGVAALMATALVAAMRLRLRVRPAFTFPEGVGARARSLAGVGIAVIAAQDAAVLVVTRLANAHGGRDGAAVTVYSYSWQIFFSVYAILAIPVAISAFPVLAARSGDAFDAAAATATRATVIASWLGAAVLAAVAVPVARAFPGLSHGAVNQFAVALGVFAPGLVGFGVAACLSRVLLADGRNQVAALAVVGGWLVVIGADVVAVPLVPPDVVVPVLGLANSVGMTASGAALLIAVRRARGSAALTGAWRAIGAGLAGAVAAAAAGLAVTVLVPASGHWPNAWLAVLAGAAATAAFCLVVVVLDGGDLRSLLARMRRRTVQ
jgi:putative peptidoglycan lipid II flippase